MSNQKIKIWHISDTHSYHGLLSVPEGVDVVIHSGDFSNYHDRYRNEPEAKDFLNWFGNLKIKHKILIAGNHDAYAFFSRKQFEEDCKWFNITYLYNSSVVIEGLKIWGSPYSPTFGDWHFMKRRDKMDKLWKTIPLDVDIVVTHTPPKGVLDLSYNRARNLEFCGCQALWSNIWYLQPKIHLFGHIHNNEKIINAGTRFMGNLVTQFSNGSVVTDGKFGTLSSNGNILEINK